MPQYAHLPLRRLEGELPRRKHGGGRPPSRIAKAHGARLAGEVGKVLQSYASKPPIGKVDPALILKVQPSTPVDKDDGKELG